MLLNWIRERTTVGLNQAANADEFCIGLDFALSPDVINALSAQIIGDLCIENQERADEMKLTLDEHELALS